MTRPGTSTDASSWLITGYIGGDALYALYEAHPEFEYALLVRGEEKGKQVAAAYPKARLVYGELDDEDVIAREAAAADIVVRKLNRHTRALVSFSSLLQRNAEKPPTAVPDLEKRKQT